VHVSAIIAAGGRGQRFGGAQPKQLQMLGGQPILRRSVEAFARCAAVTDIIVALPGDVLADPPAYLVSGGKPLQLVAGGARRRDSVAEAFARVADRADVVVVHDAARPLVTGALIERTVAAAARSGAAIAALRAQDTIKQTDASGRVRGTLPREGIYLAQTPQAFQTAILREGLALDGEVTDEATLVERAGHGVVVVDGDPRNVKITTPADLTMAERLLGGGETARMRIGNGYDLHRLVADRPLVLGGVRIPFERGLLGHSDADALCHAVTDAILGAAGAGDIGRHFPDTDPAWQGADSLELLRRAAAIVRDAGWAVGNVDAVVIAQRPRLVPHLEAMQANLAEAIGCEPAQIGVKGKTNEGVDSMGSGDSIAVHAVALLVATL